MNMKFFSRENISEEDKNGHPIFTETDPFNNKKIKKETWQISNDKEFIIILASRRPDRPEQYIYYWNGIFGTFEAEVTRRHDHDYEKTGGIIVYWKIINISLPRGNRSNLEKIIEYVEGFLNSSASLHGNYPIKVEVNTNECAVKEFAAQKV